jgi:acetoin utilization deacetylase AcuC-like enzyme
LLPDRVLRVVHSPAYLNLLELSCRRGGHLDADTYVTPASWNLAHQAAGGATAVASAVWEGQAKRGFALSRPPGHHACHGQGMGFCLLNNIALAADHLIQEKGAHRLAIVDLDLHHGNGTQDIFWKRRDIFYISVHQSPLFPGTGSINETGIGEGEGYNANFPLPPGSGDQAFTTVMDKLIIPLLDRYQPEMLMISYGFDPHWSDPLGHLLLSANGIGQSIYKLADYADIHCQGRIAVVLEGGYNLEAAAACTLSVTAALLGQPFEDPIGLSPDCETQVWKSMIERACFIWRL